MVFAMHDDTHSIQDDTVVQLQYRSICIGLGCVCVVTEETEQRQPNQISIAMVGILQNLILYMKEREYRYTQ